MVARIKRWLNAETYIVIAVIFAAIFFAKFPTLYHWLNTPKGYWYPKNTSWFDAWDTNMQVSYIRYGQRNGVMLENTYTTVPHQPVFIYQYYTFLGVLNRLLNLDPFILFHIAAIITGIFLLLACYWLAKLFFDDFLYRIAAFIIMTLGGGFGWISYFFNISADYKIAGFTMVNAFERGHDAFSTLFLLLSFIFIYLYIKNPRWKYIFWGLVTNFMFTIIHPPLIALTFTVGLVTVLLAYKKHKSLKLLSFPILTLLGFILYFFLAIPNLLNNPGFSGVVGQVIFDTNSLSILLGFGLLSPFIFLALINNNNKDERLIFLKLFFLIHLFFIFLPWGFHLYYAKGIFNWGVILGLYGIRDIFTNIKLQRIFLTFLIFISVAMRFNIFSSLMHPELNNFFFFLTKSEGETLSFLSTLPVDSAVLSLYRMGNYIPAHSDNKVYYGHKYQTPNGAETLRRVQIFYTSATEAEQRKFLKENNINYIYYGLEEAQLRKDNKLEVLNPYPYFPVLYSNDSSIVYAVDKSVSK